MKRNYPKKLINRDPRSTEHMLQAMQLMHELHEIVTTESQVKELKRHEVPQISKIVIEDKEMSKDDIMVGAFYFVEDGFMMADNVIRKCVDCRHSLQFRPIFGYSKSQPLCCFCAADRVLTEYWEKKRQ